MKFRSDINGLRAVAVTSVVIFHFFPDFLPGGFVGVDIFFVISGYLMTSIIFQGAERGDFSILRFYLSRANRIIPALSILCLSVLTFGWFFLLNADYSVVAEHALSSLGFLSNFQYWLESGYFDESAQEKWLLHTWSLSVEWQFYIIFPVVVLIFRKMFSDRAVKGLFVLGFCLGYAFSIVASPKFPSLSYFLLPTRAWELLAGSLIYLFPISLAQRARVAVVFAGVVMIISSVVLVTEEYAWPGSLALLPVLGTSLVILGSISNAQFFRNVFVSRLGIWSYSIYLWHWPLFVFVYQFYGADFYYLFAAMMGSVVLGALSYSLIEKHKSTSVMILCLTVSLSVGSLVYFSGGSPSLRSLSLDERNKLLDVYSDYEMDSTGLFDDCNASLQMKDLGYPYVQEHCLSDEMYGVLLWGDSHMGAISQGLREELPTRYSFSQLTSSGCEPSFTIKRNGPGRFDAGCDYSNGRALEYIREFKPAVVIMGAHGNHQKMDWLDSIEMMKSLGVKSVIVVGPLLQWRPSLPEIYLRSHYGSEYISDPRLDVAVLNNNAYMNSLDIVGSGGQYFDVVKELCRDGEGEFMSCRVIVGDELLAFDYGHLTVSASRYLAKKLVKTTIGE